MVGNLKDGDLIKVVIKNKEHEDYIFIGLVSGEEFIGSNAKGELYKPLLESIPEAWITKLDNGLI